MGLRLGSGLEGCQGLDMDTCWSVSLSDAGILAAGYPSTYSMLQHRYVHPEVNIENGTIDTIPCSQLRD